MHLRLKVKKNRKILNKKLKFIVLIHFFFFFILQKDQELKKNDTYQFNLVLKTKNLLGETFIGHLDIAWYRLESKGTREINKLQLSLMEICIDKRSFEIDIKTKDNCYQGDVLELNVALKNLYDQPQKFRLTITENDDFLISGDVRKNFLIATNEKLEFFYKLVPVNVGKLKLPGIMINRITASDRQLLFDSAGTRLITALPRKLEN